MNLGRGVYESNLIRNTTSSIQLDVTQRIYLARTDATVIIMDNVHIDVLKRGMF